MLGSVLNQVLLHQSVIGLESKTAMEMIGEYPDVIIGCAGGGSNLGGLIAPFMQDKLTGRADPRIMIAQYPILVIIYNFYRTRCFCTDHRYTKYHCLTNRISRAS